MYRKGIARSITMCVERVLACKFRVYHVTELQMRFCVAIERFVFVLERFSIIYKFIKSFFSCWKLAKEYFCMEVLNSFGLINFAISHMNVDAVTLWCGFQIVCRYRRNFDTLRLVSDNVLCFVVVGEVCKGEIYDFYHFYYSLYCCVAHICNVKWNLKNKTTIKFINGISRKGNII